MVYKNLRDFITFLEKRGQLRRITTPVSCELEITEITDRVSKGPEDKNVALLFENVVGYDSPVLINMFGTRQRMSWALGVNDLEEIGARVGGLVDLAIPGTLMEKLQKALEVSEAVRYAPRLVTGAPCQQVVKIGEQANLYEFPILRCWPQDGGRFITLPLVISRDPVKGTRNVGVYRMQVYDERTTGMHWQAHKGGREHQQRAQERGLPIMPVAVALGGDPATIWVGTAPLPPMIDEILFAGWLRRSPVPMVKCITQDLEVPAEAEIVLEGYVDPNEQRMEGPFGDHTGYYSLADTYPVFHITAITHRKDPIYPATIVGRPPMEDGWMGKATERIFLPLIRLFLPEVVDIDLPIAGAFHNLVIVSIKKRYPGQARKVMYGLWGLMLLSLSKNIIVVDDDVNVHDYTEVVWRVTANMDPARDIEIVRGPMDDLDHATIYPRYGGKLGLDATRKWPGEGFERPWPPDIVMSEEIKRLVDAKWKDLGLD